MDRKIESCIKKCIIIKSKKELKVISLLSDNPFTGIDQSVQLSQWIDQSVQLSQWASNYFWVKLTTGLLPI